MIDKESMTTLWQAVIIQAIRDALYEKNSCERKKAVRWVYDSSSHDFETICQLAEVEEEKIRSWLWKNLIEKRKIKTK